jgi:hypothetical protein
MMSAVQQPVVSRATPASRSGLKQWVTRHPVVAYLILAYAVSWSIFLIPLLSKEGIGLLAFDAPPVEVFILLVSLVGLAGSAFAVTAMVDGRAGVRTLDELGLVAAIRERATTASTLRRANGVNGEDAAAGLQIAVEAPDCLPPLSAAVEVAAYRRGAALNARAYGRVGRDMCG